MPVEDVEWEACLLEPHQDRQLEAYVRRELGGVPSYVAYFSTSPWIVRASVAMSPSHAGLVHTDLDLADYIGLVVSQDNSCRYCHAAQRIFMRLRGLPEARIRHVEELVHAQVGDRVEAALDFARRISRASPPASPDDLARLRSVGYSDPAIRELAFLAATNVFLNRISTLPAIPPQRLERLAHHWALSWLSPITRWFLGRRRPAPAPPAASSRPRPFDEVVLALGDLPAAGVMRGVLDEALASPVLAPRAKGLVFAVIARGLACAASEREAKRLLAEDGLSTDDVDQILRHLGSPRLDAVEAAIVPFARETIRYQPAQVQRRASAVRERLGAAPFVELIGLCALANALCRLSVVTGRP